MSAFAAALFPPVFVLERHHRQNKSNLQYRKGCKSAANQHRNWHHYWPQCTHFIHTFLQTLTFFTGTFYLFLFCLLACLCDEKVVEAQVPSQSWNGGSPMLNATDLANLMDMFPEFNDYVFQILKEHAHQQQNSVKNIQTAPLTTTSIANSNQDEWSSFLSSTNSALLKEAKDKPEVDILSQRTSYHYPSYAGWSGWNQQSYIPAYKAYHPHHDYDKYGHKYHHHHHAYDKYHHKPYHHHHHHSYHKPHYSHVSQEGYGYPPAGGGGWGWSPEPYQDPKFHYEVGYELGKHLSCLLALFGLKDFKDLSIFTIFSFLKKLKYVFLIGLAFKLGFFLSPLAVPLLTPLIVFAVIAKVLPLIIIIFLLLKLLKKQFKKPFGRYNYGWGRGQFEELSGYGYHEEAYYPPADPYHTYHPPIYHKSHLWSKLDEATKRVEENESCLEKIICTIIKTNYQNNSTGLSEQWNQVIKTMDEQRYLECDNIQCSLLTTPVLDNNNLLQI